MGRSKSQITVNTSSREKKKPTNDKMVLFEISPFHPFYHSPAARRGCCRRGNCQPQTGFWPSVWGGQPAMELVLPVASDILSRSSDFNNSSVFNNKSKLRQEINEDGVRFTLPLDGFDASGLEVKVEDGALKINAKKEEKNEQGETVGTRMMRQTVSLPEGCDADAMETSFEENGVLAITIPKKAKAIEGENNQEETQRATQEQEATQETQETPKETPSHWILATVPVRGYRPEELTVKVTENGKAIEVSGKHEERSEDGKGCSVSQFSRTFTVPQDVEVEKIESRMAGDGTELTVTAPVVRKTALETEKNIPIQMEVEQSN